MRTVKVTNFTVTNLELRPGFNPFSRLGLGGAGVDCPTDVGLRGQVTKELSAESFVEVSKGVSAERRSGTLLFV